MVRSVRTLLLLAALAAAPLHAQLPDLAPTAQTLGQDLFTRSGSTGMVLVVVRDHQTTFQSFGETALGNHQPPSADSLLRLCSLTKIFATDLLLKLALPLSTPLQQLAPAGAIVPGPESRPITLGDLATHTSGLPREIPTPRGTVTHFTFPSFPQRWAWLENPQGGQHLRTVPGTAAAYSNLGFDLLGDALQSAAHTPYAQLLAERTTRPLNMPETGFSPTPSQCARLLGGAHNEGPCTDTQNSAGSSGLYSTAADMSHWLTYLLDHQAPAAQAVYLLPASLTSVKGLDHAGDPTGIGLGWIHTPASLTDPSADFIEKTGGGAGFLTYIVLDHTHHAALFVAATDGPIETHLNLFKAANNVLLALTGQPELPVPPPLPPRPAKPAARPHVKHRRPAS